MIRKKPAPHVMQGGHRFSERIMLEKRWEPDDVSKKRHQRHPIQSGQRQRPGM